jgi:hypothetical protein
LMAVRLIEQGGAHGAGVLREGRPVGPPRRHLQSPRQRPALRPGIRRGDQGPQVARPLRRDPGRVRN